MPNKNIHLIGIGGVGMAGLAVLLKAEGHAVSGCDLAATPRTRWLESLGIPVAIGHDPAHVADADEVVVTPAVHADNPEYVAAHAPTSLRGTKRSNAQRLIRFRGEVLADLVSDHPDAIAVCGSHGKTTTSTFIAKLLRSLGESVSWAIGGETGDFPVAGIFGRANAPREPGLVGFPGSAGMPRPTVGDAKHGRANAPREPGLVVEADESDGTLARYHARTLVVTNCEYDHPDHFKTPVDYFACYETAKRQAGTVIESERLTDDGLSADILRTLDTLAPHNRQNARAAVEVARRRGHALDAIAAALPEAVRELPDRRFQVIFGRGSGSAGMPRPTVGDAKHGRANAPREPDAPIVVTDYAHHPTEMACAVRMARDICKGTLRVLFQPHRYSRTKALLADFPASFAGADEVVLCPTYAAFEEPIEGGDVADLYAACRPTVKCLFLARTCREAWRHAFFEMKDGDVTLLLGAGDIINLVHDVEADMVSRAKHGRVGSPSRPSLDGSGRLGEATLPKLTLVKNVKRDITNAYSNAYSKGSDPIEYADLAVLSFFHTGGRSVGGGARRVIGMGSNTWMSDLTTDEEYVRIDAPAGQPGATLGIPWMVGIPGTIGGWVKMNAGAFGHEISELIGKVKVDGVWIDKSACGFGYRTSSIEGVIEDVVFTGRVGGGKEKKGEERRGREG